jgi:adenylyl-sulfate kinase
VIWLTGLSASGKSTIATELERELFNLGQHVYVLDGDNMRHGLCSDLGFSPKDRKENIRRVGEDRETFCRGGQCLHHGVYFALSFRPRDGAAIDGAGKIRGSVCERAAEVCEQRDPKGLYAKARANQIKDFTGVSAPYEAPERAEIVLPTDQLTVAESVARIVEYLLGQEPGSEVMI